MTRKVLIEANNLTFRQGTGIATYAANLASALVGLGYGVDALIGTNRHIDTKDPLLSEVLLHDAVTHRPVLHRASLEWSWLAGLPLGMQARRLKIGSTTAVHDDGRLRRFDTILAVRDLADLARYHFNRYGSRVRLRIEDQPDLFHATQAIPIRVPGCPNVYTIHDLVPLKLPHTTLDEKPYFLGMVREIARRADHIITVSECSRRDIIELLDIPPSRVTNTYQSVHIPDQLLSIPRDEIANELARHFELELGEYFLFIGAIEPKKNLSSLIDAYAASGVRRPLVIVGKPGWQYEDDLAKIADERFLTYRLEDGVLKPMRRVRRLGYMPYARLVALMRGARAVAFPSLYEGFGLPVVEAMLAGAPVLTSNVSSLPEVAGDAALLVDPYDVDDIANGFASLDQDDDLCEELRNRGRLRAAEFSVERYKQRLHAIYARII
ncbi:MAG: glycosyltransferase family 4 protein [Hyphomicrobiaceae bacterium]